MPRKKGSKVEPEPVKCSPCEERASSMLKRVCAALRSREKDCSQAAEKFEKGEASIEEFASDVMGMLAGAPEDDLALVRKELDAIETEEVAPATPTAAEPTSETKAPAPEPAPAAEEKKS